MGYSGDIHTSASVDVKQTLTHARTLEILGEAACAIVIISSHGVNKKTYFWHGISEHRLLKDSEWPQLNNIPKLFVFDFIFKLLHGKY